MTKHDIERVYQKLALMHVTKLALLYSMHKGCGNTNFGHTGNSYLQKQARVFRLQSHT